MGRKLLVICLFLIIFGSLTFSFLYLSFHMSNSLLAGVNVAARNSFAQNHFLRSIFRLDSRGDARSDYYSSAPDTELKIFVFAGNGGGLYQSSVDLLEDYLPQIIHKPAGIKVIRETLNQGADPVEDSTLDQLATQIPKSGPDEAGMNIYLLTQLHDSKILGQTLGAYSFAIFKKSLEDSSDSTLDREDLEKEVILHEIGHLLGVDHLQGDNCVMSATVDTNDISNLTFTPTQYCPADLAAIQKANSN